MIKADDVDALADRLHAEACDGCVPEGPACGACETMFAAAAMLRALVEERSTLRDEGRAIGRADVGKYANAIGRIEAALGYAGARPLGETVAAVEALATRESAAIAAAVEAAVAEEREACKRDAFWWAYRESPDPEAAFRRFCERAALRPRPTPAAAEGTVDPECICGEINARHCPAHNEAPSSGRGGEGGERG